MPEDLHEPGNPWILNKMIEWSERMLRTERNANILIIILIVFSVAVALTVGLLTTRLVAPDAALLSSYEQTSS